MCCLLYVVVVVVVVPKSYSLFATIYKNNSESSTQLGDRTHMAQLNKHIPVVFGFAIACWICLSSSDSCAIIRFFCSDIRKGLYSNSSPDDGKFRVYFAVFSLGNAIIFHPLKLTSCEWKVPRNISSYVIHSGFCKVTKYTASA